MAELATLALLALALAAGGFAAHWARLPPAFGYLGTGLLFGVFAPHVPPHGLHHAAEIGILVLLFLIGLELDLKRLRSALKSTAAALPFDILVPAVLAASIGRLAGWTFLESAALGIAAAVSAAAASAAAGGGPVCAAVGPARAVPAVCACGGRCCHRRGDATRIHAR